MIAEFFDKSLFPIAQRRNFCLFIDRNTLWNQQYIDGVFCIGRQIDFKLDKRCPWIGRIMIVRRLSQSGFDGSVGGFGYFKLKFLPF